MAQESQTNLGGCGYGGVRPGPISTGQGGSPPFDSTLTGQVILAWDERNLVPILSH